MLQENTIIAAQRISLVLSPDPHPYHIANRAGAEANWRIEKARQPALFNGQVMLASAVSVDDAVLTAQCHLVPFSTFLLWRRTRRVEDAVHVFAMAVPIGSDGGVIVSKMAEATANAGLVYCPAGSFDPDDLIEGCFDPEANMQREVGEETGLDLASATPDPAYCAVMVDGAVTLFRAFRFAEKSDALLQQVRRHIRSDPEAELADAFVVHRRADITSRFARHMPIILDRYLPAG